VQKNLKMQQGRDGGGGEGFRENSASN
jgi:hypothetical protein